MEINELFVKVILIMLPGVFASLILKQLSATHSKSTLMFIINSIIMGFGIFLIMEFFCSLWNIGYCIYKATSTLKWGTNLSVWDYLLGSSKTINKSELIISYLISIPAGVLLSIFETKKYFIKFLHRLKVTDRFGDDDIWSFYMNSDEVTWVYVRDKNNDTTYYGKIRAFSDSGTKRELILENVSVYESSTASPIYDIEIVYLDLNNTDYLTETAKP